MAEPTLEVDDHFLLAEGGVTVTWQGRSLTVPLRRGGKGPPLLLLAGFWAGAATLRPLIARLRPRFEVIIPETDFQGAQDLLTDSGRLAGLLGALAEALGISPALWLAHGECALGALQFGLEQPRRMAALLLLSPPLELSRRFVARHLPLRFGSGRKAWARRACERPFEAARRLLSDVHPSLLGRPLLRQLARRLDTLPAALGLAGLLGASLQPAFRQELSALLARRLEQPQPFPVPLYGLFGKRDGQGRRQGRSLLARAFPGAQTAELADAGRLPQLEQPQEVIQAIGALR